MAASDRADAMTARVRAEGACAPHGRDGGGGVSLLEDRVGGSGAAPRGARTRTRACAWWRPITRPASRFRRRPRRPGGRAAAPTSPSRRLWTAPRAYAASEDLAARPDLARLQLVRAARVGADRPRRGLLRPGGSHPGLEVRTPCAVEAPARQACRAPYPSRARPQPGTTWTLGGAVAVAVALVPGRDAQGHVSAGTGPRLAAAAARGRIAAVGARDRPQRARRPLGGRPCAGRRPEASRRAARGRGLLLPRGVRVPAGVWPWPWPRARAGPSPGRQPRAEAASAGAACVPAKPVPALPSGCASAVDRCAEGFAGPGIDAISGGGAASPRAARPICGRRAVSVGARITAHAGTDPTEAAASPSPRRPRQQPRNPREVVPDQLDPAPARSVSRSTPWRSGVPGDLYGAAFLGAVQIPPPWRGRPSLTATARAQPASSEAHSAGSCSSLCAVTRGRPAACATLWGARQRSA